MLSVREMTLTDVAVIVSYWHQLEKAGFEFVKEYVTIPGFLNFEQPVKQWQVTREKFEEL